MADELLPHDEPISAKLPTSRRWRADLAATRPRRAEIAGRAAALTTLALALIVGALWPSAARADEESVERRLGDDRFLAGRDVALRQATRGDALLAGGSVDVDAEVGGDGLAAGGELRLNGPFRGNLYAAGGQVTVGGPIGGNARMAGGRLTLERDARVAGNLSVAAGELRVEGPVEGYLQAAGGQVFIGDRVGGDVEVWSDDLELGSEARVEGGLTLHGANPPRLASGARVAGSIEHVPSAESEPGGWLAVLGAVMAALSGWLGFALVGGLLIAAWPGLVDAVTSELRKRPTRSLAVGLGVVGGTPVLIVLALLTVIGIPLGLLLLLPYVLLFPLGYLACALSLSELALERLRPGRAAQRGARILSLAGVLLGLIVVGLLPVLGFVLGMLVTLAGIGSLIVAAFERHRQYRAPRDPEPAEAPPTGAAPALR